MKKRVQYLVGVLLVTPFLVLAPMAAAESTNSGSGSAAAATPTTTPTETPDKELARLVELEGKKETQVERLKNRITEFKVKLSAAEQAKIKAKCVVAQDNVKLLETRLDTGVVTRGKAYDELLSHLDKIIAKLKADKVSTTELEAERTALALKISTFKTDLAKYKLDLDDLKALGCVADPSSFKAALEAARAARATVATDALAIRNHMTETVKPTLKTIRATLEKTTGTTTPTDTTTPISGGTN